MCKSSVVGRGELSRDPSHIIGFPQVPGIVLWPAIRNSLNLQDEQTLPKTERSDMQQAHVATGPASIDLKQVGKIDGGQKSKDKEENKNQTTPGWLAANPLANGL